MPEKLDKIGQTTSASLKKFTGKTWDQWISVLKKEGALLLTRKEIVSHLKRKHKLSGWWQQIVATGFEVASGRRIEGQDSKGEYQVTVSRTVHHDSKKVWKFMSSIEGLAIWLRPLSEIELKPKAQFEAEGEIFGEIRTMKAPERVRLTWQESDWDKHTVLNVGVYGRENGTAIIVFQHGNLPTTRLREQMRSQWNERLDALKSEMSLIVTPAKGKRPTSAKV